MKLAIVHYHLNRGGVTSVILNHLQSLDVCDSNVTDVVVLHGPGESGWTPDFDNGRFTLHSICLPSLEYSNETPDPKVIVNEIDEKLEELQFDKSDSVVQIHNHNLGKNPALTAASKELADLGYHLLLQIHDFAEDFRPQNYATLFSAAKHYGWSTFNELVYPVHPRINFALLNRKDQQVIETFGISSGQLHYLPNPSQEFRQRDTGIFVDRVAVRSALNLERSPSRLVLYPVRGIRRKNLSEAVLFAAANRHVQMVVTLPAESTQELDSYNQIKDFCTTNQLPVTFEACRLPPQFFDWIRSADFLFSSSVAEGFGMVFLEAWLHDKQLVGRRINEITSDFEQNGLQLDGMYSRVAIPIDWIEWEQEIEQFDRLFQKVCSEYRNVAIDAATQPSLQELAFQVGERRCVDFAKLSWKSRQQAILDVQSDGEKKAELFSLNPKFRVPVRSDRQLIEKNAKIVRELYQSKKFGIRFQQVLNDCLYDAPCESGTNQEAALLKEFLIPERFYPLRVE